MFCQNWFPINPFQAYRLEEVRKKDGRWPAWAIAEEWINQSIHSSLSHRRDIAVMSVNVVSEVKAVFAAFTSN